MVAPALVASRRFLVVKQAGRRRVRWARALCIGIAVALAGLCIFVTRSEALIVAWNGGTISCSDAPTLLTGAPEITVDDEGSSYRDWYIQHIMYWDGYQWQWGGWSHWHSKYRNANPYFSNWNDVTTQVETGSETWEGAVARGWYAVYTWIYDGERGQYLERYFGQWLSWWYTGQYFCQESPENNVFGSSQAARRQTTRQQRAQRNVRAVPAVVSATAARSHVQSPDLVVGFVSSTASVVTVGAHFPVSLLVSNVGKEKTKGSQTAYFLSVDRKLTKDDLSIEGTFASRPTPGLLSKHHWRAAGNLIVPSKATGQSYYVLACADRFRQVHERSERNNCRASAKTILVKLAALVTASPPSPPPPAPPPATTPSPPPPPPPPPPSPPSNEEPPPPPGGF
jgi:hypothetical protein